VGAACQRVTGIDGAGIVIVAFGLGTSHATALRSITECLLGAHVVIVTGKPILTRYNFTGAVQANGHGAGGEVVLGAVFIPLAFSCGSVYFLNRIRKVVSYLGVYVIPNGNRNVVLISKSRLRHSFRDS